MKGLPLSVYLMISSILKYDRGETVLHVLRAWAKEALIGLQGGGA